MCKIKGCSNKDNIKLLEPGAFKPTKQKKIYKERASNENINSVYLSNCNFHNMKNHNRINFYFSLSLHASILI